MKNGEIHLKWINDLFCNEKKIGGVLTIAQTSGKDKYILASIGININSNPIPEVSTCIKEEINSYVDTKSFSEKLNEYFAFYIHKLVIENQSKFIIIEYQKNL